MKLYLINDNFGNIVGIDIGPEFGFGDGIADIIFDTTPGLQTFPFTPSEKLSIFNAFSNVAENAGVAGDIIFSREY